MARRALVALAAIGLVACSSSGDQAQPPATAVAASGSGAPIDQGMRTSVTAPSGSLVLSTLSTRAAFVSGGDVRIGLSGPGASEAEVRRNGEDVSRDLVAAPGGNGDREGVVDGLKPGENVIEASAGGDVVRLTVIDHDRSGPILAGPHLDPWVCTTTGVGLGIATDANCNAPSFTSWSYRSTDGSIKQLPDPAVRPADLDTTTVNGNRVPFIIRSEKGVIDRGIYFINVLDPDPANRNWDRTGWNDRLVYRFGGGCGTQYSQGTSLLGSGLSPDLLAKGYAIATNTIDTFQTACNDVLSAEAAMMTREYFAEAYGAPRFTIGDGGSGGAIQQLLIAQNYPGLLDALVPSLPFPDAITIAAGVTDCGLLAKYFPTSGLTDAQKIAISGTPSLGTCDMWGRLFLGGVNPTDDCPSVPKERIYNAVTNPTGVRCTLQDMSVAIYGRDAKGFARRPLDNRGVEYGLAPLNAGTITVDQFLDLNERVGGWDIDGNVVPARTAIDEETAAVAYRTGRVAGEPVLRELPIILRNVFTDDLGDIHTRFRAFSVRERLRDGGADAPNLLLWTDPPAGRDLIRSLTGDVGAGFDPIYLVDQWLTTGSKPAEALNRCKLPDGTVLTGGWELYDQPGPCRDAYPVAGDTRTVAGQPIRDDIIACTRRPVDPAAYKVPFDAAQAARLGAVFPDGVCDYTKPGLGQQPATGTWQVYG